MLGKGAVASAAGGLTQHRGNGALGASVHVVRTDAPHTLGAVGRSRLTQETSDRRHHPAFEQAGAKHRPAQGRRAHLRLGIHDRRAEALGVVAGGLRRQRAFVDPPRDRQRIPLNETLGRAEGVVALVVSGASASDSKQVG